MTVKRVRSIKATRRGFLGALSATPVIGPLVAKKAAEEQAKSLSGIALGNMAPMDAFPMMAPPPAQVSAVARMFKDEILSLLAQEQRDVRLLDHDLAANKSMSLAAKIYHQRQRNIKDRYDTMVKQSVVPWYGVNNFVMRKLGLKP